eukprot:scaffold12155_cov50-Attheya_sp.AAC.4
MQRNLIDLEKVTTKLARSNNYVCRNCSNFDTPTEPSSVSNNDDSGDSDLDDDDDKQSRESKQSKPERTMSSTSITSPNCTERSHPTTQGTLSSSKKKRRDRNAQIRAMLPTRRERNAQFIGMLRPEEREKFNDHLSQWVKRQFGTNHFIGTLHLTLTLEEFMFLQQHLNWWIRCNLQGPVERLEQLQNREREERRSKKRHITRGRRSHKKKPYEKAVMNIITYNYISNELNSRNENR